MIYLTAATTSNVHFSHLAADCFHDLKLVWVNHLDLGLVTHKSRDANVRQRRSERHIIRPKLPGGAPFIKRVPRIKRGSNGKVIRFEAYLAAKAVETKAPVVEMSSLAPDQVTVNGVEGDDGICQASSVNIHQPRS